VQKKLWHLAVISIFAMATSHCSNLKLVPRAASVGGFSAETTAVLPPPLIKIGSQRILFFVDQSFSMIQGKCPSDIDGTNPDNSGNTNGCVPAPGIDPEAHRYDAIQAWLTELKNGLMLDPDADVKVAIIPFSGGKMERPTYKERIDADSKFKFLSLDDAFAWLDQLRQEHRDDLAGATNQPRIDPMHMGTTVPFPTLVFADSLLDREAQLLQQKGTVSTTRFQFIYLSDGVFKPLEGYLDIVKRTVNCPLDCSATPNLPACNPNVGLCNNGICPYQYCNVKLPYDFRVSFGDPADNKLEHIVAELQQIQNLRTRYSTGPMSMSLVQIHPERILSEDKDSDGVKNIFDALISKVTGPQKYVLTGPNPPFSLTTGGGVSLSYRLRDFYAVNLNAFVNASGRLVVDSDGDGLPDNQELLIGTDPTKLRSGDGNCSDGITQGFGCRTFGCSASLDSDGDGLNQCEEITLGTDNDYGDSDGDGLLDYYEVLRKLNPLRDDSKSFTDGSATNDLLHFLAGSVPQAHLDGVPGPYKVDVRVEPAGYTQVTGQLGVKYLMGIYNIRINNIPLMPTLATKSVPTLYRDKAQTKAIPAPLMIGPTGHRANVNQIVMIAHVVANENPELDYWLFKKMEIEWSAGLPTRSLPVDFSSFQQIDIGRRK